MFHPCLLLPSSILRLRAATLRRVRARSLPQACLPVAGPRHASVKRSVATACARMRSDANAFKKPVNCFLHLKTPRLRFLSRLGLDRVESPATRRRAEVRMRSDIDDVPRRRAVAIKFLSTDAQFRVGVNACEKLLAIPEPAARRGRGRPCVTDRGDHSAEDLVVGGDAEPGRRPACSTCGSMLTFRR